MISTTLSSLTSAKDGTALLAVLKDLKNAVIGNTWKKVEVAEDEEVLLFLLQWLDLPTQSTISAVNIDIVVEIAVIIGALANVGTLTLRPLLLSQAPRRLVHLIHSASASTISAIDKARLLSSALRALRNVLMATADLVWGYMWGVGMQRKVVTTGLGDSRPSVGAVAAKGKGREVDKVEGMRRIATDALAMVFDDENLTTLLSLLDYTTNLQILLPLYQLLTRLIALPSHREALARWRPPSSDFIPGPSVSSKTAPSRLSYILSHLLESISPSASEFSTTRRNPKLLEAALDLLAALVKGESELAGMVMDWSPASGSIKPDDQEDTAQGSVSQLIGLMAGAPTGVRIAAASCLTNLVRAEKDTPKEDTSVRTGAVNRHLLDVVVRLLEGENLEERIKLCFVLAALVSDDPVLQKAAADKGCPTLLLGMYVRLDEQETAGELGGDPASRAREAALLALASLAFQTESTRTAIAEYTPPFLPYLLRALSHASYGVRAAACQLARALSRTVAILRTSLIDSGVADAIIKLLRDETQPIDSGIEGGGEWDGEVASSEERGWVVEVAATGVICNLVADFSPLRTKLLADGGLALLVTLTRSPFGPLALNALWAIKNMTFRAAEATKVEIMAEVGYDHLKTLMSPMMFPPLRAQALSVVQNLVADEAQAELGRTVDSFGEKDFLDLVQVGAIDKDVDVQIPALFILSNLALGNERMRQSLVSRVEILEALSEALNSKSDAVKYPSLRTLRHLLQASTRSRRPRQAIVDLFQPYQLRTRLGVLAESALGFDVRHAAAGLAELLDRAKGESGIFGTR